jgi:hypothetical protein
MAIDVLAAKVPVRRPRVSRGNRVYPEITPVAATMISFAVRPW